MNKQRMLIGVFRTSTHSGIRKNTTLLLSKFHVRRDDEATSAGPGTGLWRRNKWPITRVRVLARAPPCFRVCPSVAISLSLGLGRNSLCGAGQQGGTLLQRPQLGRIFWSAVTALPRASRLNFGTAVYFRPFLVLPGSSTRHYESRRKADRKTARQARDGYLLVVHFGKRDMNVRTQQ